MGSPSNFYKDWLAKFKWGNNDESDINSSISESKKYTLITTYIREKSCKNFPLKILFPINLRRK